jgi:hypothetical protein
MSVRSTFCQWVKRTSQPLFVWSGRRAGIVRRVGGSRRARHVLSYEGFGLLSCAKLKYEGMAVYSCFSRTAHTASTKRCLGIKPICLEIATNPACSSLDIPPPLYTTVLCLSCYRETNVQAGKAHSRSPALGVCILPLAEPMEMSHVRSPSSVLHGQREQQNGRAAHTTLTPHGWYIMGWARADATVLLLPRPMVREALCHQFSWRQFVRMCCPRSTANARWL